MNTHKISYKYKVLSPFLSFALLLVFALPACASEDGGLPWGDFLLRILNVAIFLGIIIYFAGGKIKGTLIGRGQKIVSDMEGLEARKKKAMEDLEEVEKRIANVNEECAKILEDGKQASEKIAQAIVSDAEKQAHAIVEQAHKSAEQAIKTEIAAIRAKITDDIMLEVRKTLEQNLDSKKHQALIDNSLAQVSNF